MDGAAGCKSLMVGIAVALAWAASAQAAVTTGSQSEWPSGAFNVNTGTYNPSVERLDVRYDDAAAKVTTLVTLDRALAPSQYFYFGYTLSRPQTGRSCANSQFLVPLAHFDGYVWTGDSPYRGGSAYFDANSGYTGNVNASVAMPSTRQYEFTVAGGQALTRQALRCASSLYAQGADQSYNASNFCLGTCPTETAPPPSTQLPLPPAPTGVRASVTGQTATLNWNASSDPSFSYFAIRRGTQPDTNTGTWTRLPGNYTSPTVTDSPPPGTYWYYVTQINTRGQVSARSANVRVVIPRVGVTNPGGGTGSGPQPTGGGQGGAPVVRTTPPTTPGQTSISAEQARRQARIALRQTYGAAFRNATRLRLACRSNSAAKQTCRVSWRTSRYRYRGQVVVRLSASGYATAVDVSRTRRRR